MYNKILVAIDHSPASQTVFDSALTLAKLAGSELMLLHALSLNAEDSPLNAATISMGYDLEKFEQEWEQFITESLKRLKPLVKSAQYRESRQNLLRFKGSLVA